MAEINTDEESLKKFAFTMFAALVIIATILFLRHKNGYFWVYSIALLFILLGHFSAGSLKPAYIAWMKLAYVLGWINTRLLLCLIFYLVITPIGLILKLSNKGDLLDKRINIKKDSYWKKKESVSNISDFEKQF